MSQRRLLAVAVGGVVGTWARWGASALFPVSEGTFPVTTFVVNMIGAACIGVVVVLFLDRRPARPVVHSLLGTGLLGGFTTFSAFSVESVELLRLGHTGVAAVYVVASVVVGVLLAWSSVVVARRVARVERWTGVEPTGSAP